MVQLDYVEPLVAAGPAQVIAYSLDDFQERWALVVAKLEEECQMALHDSHPLCRSRVIRDIGSHKTESPLSASAKCCTTWQVS